ncbi:hypothetical protein [Marinitoga litoralis]|uniref:hypothetical protein n=1 Tax=Marinitoga litoralis TaxID=570855 RepID=UPI00195F8E80|nr:hypothetical protein [Marinitoga litoralis]MBM7559492.1 hypothetical protein [Marinitoga litoralis]
MDSFLTSFISILNLIFSIAIFIVVIKLSYIVMKLPLKSKINEEKKDNLSNKCYKQIKIKAKKTISDTASDIVQTVDKPPLLVVKLD